MMVTRRRASVPFAAAAVLTAACLDMSKQATCPLPPGQVAPQRCSAGTRASDDGLIDDFEDGNTQVSQLGDRGGYWFTSHDPDGSTIDPSPFAISAGGAGTTSQKALHVYGQTSSASGAWGILVGANFVSDGVYDASKYAGVSFKAKVGKDSTKTLRFKVADVNTHPDGGVCKNCWNHFGKEVTLSNDWQEVTVPFVDLRQETGWGEAYPSLTTSKVMALNWSIGPGRAYDLWIDDVQFFECK
jgi:hypothetical protein